MIKPRQRQQRLGEILDDAVKKAKIRRKGIRLSRLDLRRHDFCSADLVKAEFYKCRLRACRFAGSNLDRGAVWNSDLSEADFSDAHCPGIDFSGSVLCGACFRRTNLRSAVFSGTDSRSADFKDASFVGGDLRRSDLSRCRAEGADFKNVVLDEARLDGADLRAANFNGASLRDLKARDAVFVGSVFRAADLTGAVLNGADCSSSDLTGANLKFSCVKNVRLEGARLFGADFRFSRGLTRAAKKSLKREGARVTVWSDKAVLALLSLGLALGIFRFFSSYQYLDISTLRIKTIEAKEQRSYRRAIRMDLALSRKVEMRENLGAMLNWAFDAAGIYKTIGRRSQALKLLTGLLKKVRDKVLVARIYIEIAAFRMEEGDFDKAAALVKDIHVSMFGDDDETLWKLAQIYRGLKKYPEAAVLLKKMLEKPGLDPGRRSEIEQALVQISRDLDSGSPSRRGPQASPRSGEEGKTKPAVPS